MNFKRKEGITLIALVVTIVVLLILAGVAISMLTGENGIINQALQAKEQNEIAEEKEKVQLAAVAAAGKDGWGEITEENLKTELDTNIGSGKYNIDKDVKLYVVTYTESKRSYYIDEDGKVGEVVEREGLKVGDYINYIPDENIEGYKADKLSEEITGSISNTSTINQDSQYAEDGEGMTWQILRIYADGSIDLIGSETSQAVNFQGANGYNNGVTVMNDICETLYSRGTIKARSINYEDLESWLTDEAKEERDAYSDEGGPTYGHTQTYITNRYYPNLYAQEIGGKIDSGLIGLTEGIDKEQGNITGLDISDEGTASDSTQASTSLTVTQTYWDCAMNSTNFGEGYNALKTTNIYWVASRYARCDSGPAGFGLRFVRSSNIDGYRMFFSDGSTLIGNLRLRPVVSLPSSVKIEASTETNDINHMHKITQY